jgi:hypothetical protein
LVTTSVVLEKTDKARAKVIEKWIKVADKCLELNNVSSPLDIVSGVGAAAVHRLRHSWSVRLPPL